MIQHRLSDERPAALDHPAFARIPEHLGHPDRNDVGVITATYYGSDEGTWQEQQSGYYEPAAFLAWASRWGGGIKIELYQRALARTITYEMG